MPPNPETTRRVGILLFEEAEPLDYAGPFEVFVAAGRRANLEPFEAFTVAERAGLVTTRGGLRVHADHGFADAPRADVLVVPGGFGSRRAMRDKATLAWVTERAGQAEAVLSVCTGALILGAAGLLEGKRATTHFGSYDLLREVAPGATVCPGARYLDNGQVVVAAGVSAGIDAALHLVGRYLGDDLADECAAYLEYDWRARTPD